MFANCQPLAKDSPPHLLPSNNAAMDPLVPVVPPFTGRDLAELGPVNVVDLAVPRAR